MILGALALAIEVFREASRKLPPLKNTLAVTMTGSLALLVTNAADPYLQVPGHIWWLYLPLGVANVMLSRASSPVETFRGEFMPSPPAAAAL